MRASLICVAGLMILSGCGVTAQQKAVIMKTPNLNGRGNIISVPANLRTIDLHIQKDSSFAICTEPPPDVVVNNALQVAMEVAQNQKISLSKRVDTNAHSAEAENSINGKVSGSIATTAIELAGRTQIVLLAREFMYRNCISRANGWISDSDYQQNQVAIVRQISSLISADSTKAEAEKAKAKAAEAVAINSTSKSDMAFQLERKAFQALLNKDINEAIKFFGLCEDAYSEFHSASEIHSYLVSIRSDKVDWISLYNMILSRFSWKMPADIRREMAQEVKDQTKK